MSRPHKTDSSIYLKIFSIPILLYALFILIRIKGIQPPMEGELGDFITALNFLFGAFVSYFIFVLAQSNTIEISRYESLWWWLMCVLLMLLAFDELFMIHETIGLKFNINDTLVLLSYGAFLGLLLVFRFREAIRKNTLFFMIVFAFFSVLSQGADYLYGEGSVVIMNRDISYEQFAESFGALSLTCAIVTIAIRQVAGGSHLNLARETPPAARSSA